MKSYNYPWAGRLGTFRCCVVCGNDGHSYQYSSIPALCLKCRSTDPPNPELAAEYRAWVETTARRWCAVRGFDYDEIVTKLALWYGTPDPIRPKEVPVAGPSAVPAGTDRTGARVG